MVMIVCSTAVLGQQVPFYNHYFLNPFVYNPAFTGYSDNVRASLVRNSRNGSFDGGAINNYLTVDAAFSEWNSGLGLMLVGQTHGIQQQFGGNLSYAYFLRINQDHRIRFGVQAGFMDNQIDESEINVEDQDDPYLQNLRKNKLAFNGMAGLAYEWKQLRVGFSIPQILGNKVTFGQDGSRGSYLLQRHYMASAAYSFELTSNGKWLLTPYFLTRFAPGLPYQFDGLLRVEHKDWGWLSAGYKSDYAVEFNAGVRLFKSLEIGYSYELVIGSLNAYHSGMNHEFLLGYTFGKGGDSKRLAELEAKNRQLANDKQEAEDRLRAMLEEKQRERDQFVKDSLAMEQAMRDSLLAQEARNRELEARNKELEAQNARLKQENEKPVEKPVVQNDEDDTQITKAKGYYFVELDQSESPNGYYVITGVFSNRSNADTQKQLCLDNGFNETRLVINKNTGLYYIVILLTPEKAKALETNRNYLKNVNKKTWVLNYDKP